MNITFELLQENKLEEIAERYQPNEIAKKLVFKDGMILCYQLILNEEMDDNLREYGVRLIEENRRVYPIEWNKDWRNDIFLGDAYYLVMKYNERYKAYNPHSAGHAASS